MTIRCVLLPIDGVDGDTNHQPHQYVGQYPFEDEYGIEDPNHQSVSAK